LEDIVVTHATLTRTGFVPNKPNKQNQDSMVIVRNFANIKNNWFFGVFDGHGINGHFASDHIKEYLPGIFLTFNM
jgi:serine/threonine protein phosphatase PrpC